MHVEELRDGRVQAVHNVASVEVAANGTVAGTPAWAYWRSSPKPLQALAFLRSGAADHFGFTARELALACASHNGEEKHVDVARGMLAKIDLPETALRCGSHDPIRGPNPPQPIHNNCSGKHAAMLATCLHKDWSPATYNDATHPLQQMILDVVEQAIGRRPDVGGDGCTVPTFWATTTELAQAWQWLDQDADGRRALDAMATHPDMVAGEGRLCTAIPQVTAGRFVGKVGAAGLYVVLDRGTGVAFAAKAESGVAFAVEAAAAAWIEQRAGVDLSAWSHKPIVDCRGATRGAFAVRPT